MPSIRIGFSTDFNLTSEQVGIGTTLPSARLDVAGQILSDNSSGSGGLSTITRYDGFLGSEQRVTSNISIAQTTKGNLNSLSGEIVIEDEVTVTDDTPLTGGRLDSLTVTGKFDLPHGGTEDREDTPEKGSTRFNQDLGQLEFYTGYEWRTVGSYDGSGRGRGVFGAQTPGNRAQLEFANITTLGNTSNFGALSLQRFVTNGCSSSIRGVFGGGYNPSVVAQNVIDYIAISSEGNAIDFGDLSVGRARPGSASSSTRGIWAGGATPTLQNVIDYVEISTLGNALDFGDLSIPKRNVGGCSSPTRALFAGGNTGAATSRIESVTISSKGDAVRFGDLIAAYLLFGGLSNTTRGFWTGSGTINDMQYVTIASFGNATDFGDLTVLRGRAGGASNSIRGLWAGGYQNPGSVSQNTIDYITLATTGNAQDFGDLTEAGFESVGISDSHGGLGGF
jgi:hypothetical protein